MEWAGDKVGEDFGAGNPFGEPVDAHLTFELDPAEEERDLRIGRDLPRLPALEVREENKAVRVELLEQDDAGEGLSVRVDRGHRHRVRLGQFGLPRMLHPEPELLGGILGKFVAVEPGSLVFFAEGGEVHDGETIAVRRGKSTAVWEIGWLILVWMFVISEPLDARMQLDDLRREWELCLRERKQARHDRVPNAGRGASSVDAARRLLWESGRSRRELPLDRALHFGCGTAELTQGLVPFFNSVLGVDLSPALIEGAREAARAYPRRASFRRLHEVSELMDLEADTYDFIHCSRLLGMAGAPLRRGLILQLLRLLKPGGVCVLESGGEAAPAGECLDAFVQAGARLLAMEPEGDPEQQSFTKDAPYAPALSVAVPFYNEGNGVERFFELTTPVLESLGMDFEIVCINDGSRDDTLVRLRAKREKDRRVRVIDLTRNFGKESALAAALDCSRGRVVVPMDADLQDPPEIIGQMLERWREGFPVVIARRKEREGESWLKRQSARCFYQFYNGLAETPIPGNTGDFRLIDREVLDALKSLRERNRFTKGLFAWLGYPTAEVFFDRRPRYAGRTKWNYWRLWNFALDGIFSFSTVPLRVWTYIGGLMASFSFLYGFYLLLRTLFFLKTTPGYASLMVAMLFLGGIQLIGLGILGEYLGRVFKEAKGRPLYLIHREID